MLRGLLKTRSVDINNIQKIVDPLILSIIFHKVNHSSISFDFNFFINFFIILTILNLNKLYESYRIKYLINLIPNIFSLSAVITIVVPFLYLNDSNTTKYELIFFFGLCFLYLFFHHYALRLFLRYLRSKGLNTRNAAFLGNKDSYELVKNQLEKYPWLGYKLIYWFSPNKEDYLKKESNLCEYICDGDLNELVKMMKSDNVDNLFFCHRDGDEISLKNVLRKLGNFCIPVTYLIDWDINSISLKKEYFGDVVGLNIWNPIQSILNEKIKRFFDLSFGFLLLIVLSPFLIIIFILIKVSSEGPGIYLQERYGLNGVSFKMLKFRTMYISQNQKVQKIVQAKKNDLRITKIGRFLRKYSLDELPQLINVLKGEMSLVGPRPHAVQHNEFYRNLIIGYMQRHSKIPGMTGLAQINGARGETTCVENMRKRIEFDIDYNNNWSLMKDFQILIKTFLVVLNGKGY